MLDYTETIKIGKKVEQEAKQHKIRKEKLIKKTMIIGSVCVIAFIVILLLI